MAIERLIKRPPSMVPGTATCAEAARRMREEEVGSLVVVDHERPVGIVTDRDLVVRVLAESRDPAAVPVGEVMTGMPVFASSTRGLDDVIQLMRDLAVRRVPVVDEHQRAIGMVSLDDVVLLLSEQLAAIAETIRKEMPAG